MSTLLEIPSEEDFSTHLTSLPPSSLLILYFHAPWAAPCAHMRTVLSALASTYPTTTSPPISFVSINAEELADISETYDVTAVPFVVIVRNSEVLESVSGSDATKVRDAVERHAGRGAAADSNGDATKQPSAIPPPLTATPRDNNAPVTATQAPVNANGAPTAKDEEDPVAKKEKLFARLDELVKAAPVMLFMKGTPSGPQCGFSRQLVAILRERSVKYGFFNILADDDVRQGLKEFADWPTFPQLWVNGELVGGLDIVKEEMENDPGFFNAYAVHKPAAAV